jgi:hypothetical protein
LLLLEPFHHHFTNQEGFERAERGRGGGAKGSKAGGVKGAGLTVQTVAWELLLGGYSLETAIDFLQGLDEQAMEAEMAEEAEAQERQEEEEGEEGEEEEEEEELYGEGPQEDGKQKGEQKGKGKGGRKEEQKEGGRQPVTLMCGSALLLADAATGSLTAELSPAGIALSAVVPPVPAAAVDAAAGGGASAGEAGVGGGDGTKQERGTAVKDGDAAVVGGKGGREGEEQGKKEEAEEGGEEEEEEEEEEEGEDDELEHMLTRTNHPLLEASEEQYNDRDGDKASRRRLEKLRIELMKFSFGDDGAAGPDGADGADIGGSKGAGDGAGGNEAGKTSPKRRKKEANADSVGRGGKDCGESNNGDRNACARNPESAREIRDTETALDILTSSSKVSCSGYEGCEWRFEFRRIWVVHVMSYMGSAM